MDCSTPGLPVHQFDETDQLPELAQTHVHRVGDAIPPSHPLSSPSPPPLIFPSIRVFSNESTVCIRWSKYWNFSFSISPSKEHSGLITFRIYWFNLLAVQKTLRSLLPNTTVLKHQFVGAQPLHSPISHLYMTTAEPKALTRQTFVGKVMSLLFNMLSKLGITFLPRSKHLLIHGCSRHLQ